MFVNPRHIHNNFLIIFYPIDDNEAALRKFRAGELDINNGYPENKSQWLKKNMSNNIKHDDIMVISYLIFNSLVPPFDDKDIRKAVSLSIDILNFNEMGGSSLTSFELVV